MKNIVENQCIKTDKPLPMSYEALKAERDALEIRLRNALSGEKEAIQRAHAANQTADDLAVENQALNKSLDEVCDAYENGQRDLLSEAIDKAINLPTPATDTALAAIRLEAKIEGANELAERIAGMHSKTAPGSYIEKKLMLEAGAAIAYANGLRDAK